MEFDVLRCLSLLLVGVVVNAANQPASAGDPLVFVSAFADGDQSAIHAYGLELASGSLKPMERTTGVEHPFFLAVSPDQKFLYSIHAKQFGGKEDEQVAAYELVGRTGKLKLLNRQSARGRRPATCTSTRRGSRCSWRTT